MSTAATETGPVRPRGVRAALRARAAGQGLRARPQHVEQPLDRQLYPRLRDLAHMTSTKQYFIFSYAMSIKLSYSVNLPFLYLPFICSGPSYEYAHLRLFPLRTGSRP